MFRDLRFDSWRTLILCKNQWDDTHPHAHIGLLSQRPCYITVYQRSYDMIPGIRLLPCVLFIFFEIDIFDLTCVLYLKGTPRCHRIPSPWGHFEMDCVLGTITSNTITLPHPAMKHGDNTTVECPIETDRGYLGLQSLALWKSSSPAWKGCRSCWYSH
jgi:hypothetical protein